MLVRHFLDYNETLWACVFQDSTLCPSIRPPTTTHSSLTAPAGHWGPSVPPWKTPQRTARRGKGPACLQVLTAAPFTGSQLCDLVFSSSLLFFFNINEGSFCRNCVMQFFVPVRQGGILFFFLAGVCLLISLSWPEAVVVWPVGRSGSCSGKPSARLSVAMLTTPANQKTADLPAKQGHGNAGRVCLHMCFPSQSAAIKP